MTAWPSAEVSGVSLHMHGGGFVLMRAYHFLTLQADHRE